MNDYDVMNDNGKKTSLIFYMGKGGTGKSTVSVISAMLLAKAGKKVMVASFDAAHNLGDIFKVPLSHKPRQIMPGLLAAEIDRERMIQVFLNETRESLKRSYSYLTAFNLDGYFDVLKFSPGLEEHALIRALVELMQENQDLDYLIIDMPPTALSVKFFILPTLSRIWIEQLEKLRNEINKKKNIVSTVRYGKKEHGRDKILNRILTMKENYIKLEALFRDMQTTTISVVVNNDSLSVSETQRIVADLLANDLHIKSVVWNRVESVDGLPQFSIANNDPLFIPASASHLTGIESLETFLSSWNINASTLLKKVKNTR